MKATRNDKIRVNSMKLDPRGFGRAASIVANLPGLRITVRDWESGTPCNAGVEEVNGVLRVWYVIALNRYAREVRCGVLGDLHPMFVGFVEEGDDGDS